MGWCSLRFGTSRMQPVWPEKNRQMSIKVTQEWFHYKNDRFWYLYQKLPKNVGDLGKLIAAKGFEIVALSPINHQIWSHWMQQLITRTIWFFISFY